MADLQAEMARFEAELAQSNPEAGMTRPPGPGAVRPPQAARPGFQMQPPAYYPAPGGAPGRPGMQPWGNGPAQPPSRLPGPPPAFSQAPPASYPNVTLPRPPQTLQPPRGHNMHSVPAYSSAPYGAPAAPSQAQPPQATYSAAAYTAPAAPAQNSVQATYSAAPQASAHLAAKEFEEDLAQPSNTQPDSYKQAAVQQNAAPQTQSYAAAPQIAVPMQSGDVKILNAAKSAAIVQPGKRQSEVYSNIQEAFASQKASKKPKYGVAREAAGKKWVDPNLLEWPENDFRIFVGDIGNETNDEVLTKAFAKYPAFNKAKVVRDKKSNKTKGFGFVSFSDPIEGAKALREMDGKYIGNRPCKLKKSSWTERNQEEQRYVPGKKKNHIMAGGVKKAGGVLHK